MQTPRAAIYARISSDKTGAGLGVERQAQDCRDLAVRLGLEVAAIYADNDISAYGGKRRPGYQQLLGAMRSGEINAVLTWHGDRLHRSMVELEDYVTASEIHGVSTHTVKAGHIDLATPSGRLIARQLGAVARYEVEHSIERQKAAKLQGAKSGAWGGGQRPYGYMADGMTVNQPEATIVQEITDRFTRGSSWRSLAIDLNQRGITTANGKLWNAAKVMNVATRLRNVGIREHNGAQYPAQWDALVTQPQWDALQTAIIVSRSNYRARGTYRKYLLKGYVYCGYCGNPLNSNQADNRDGTYSPVFRCRSKDLERGIIGCGKTSRRMAPLEHLITEAVMYRLDGDGLAQLLSTNQTDTPKLRGLLERQRSQEARLTEIVDLFSANALTFAEYQVMKSGAQLELASLRKQIDLATAGTALANVPVGQSLRTAWDHSDLKWKRQLLDVVIDKIWIDLRPSIKGYRTPSYETWLFDPSLIRIDWKV